MSDGYFFLPDDSQVIGASVDQAFSPEMSVGTAGSTGSDFGSTWFGGTLNTVISAAADRYKLQSLFSYAPVAVDAYGRPVTAGTYQKQAVATTANNNQLVMLAGVALFAVLLMKMAK